MTGTAAATDWPAVVAVLRHAMRLCARGWCQGKWAVNGEGLPCCSLDAGAVRFCPDGAFNRACRDLGANGDVRIAAHDAFQFNLRACFQLWNDAEGRTQDEVLGHFAASISRLEAAHGAR